MKNNKKLKTALIVFIVILAFVLCFNVGVYAAYALAATEVSYTKPDGTTTNVKAALDELYADNPLASAVSVGDYVAYDAGTHSYTSLIGTEEGSLSNGNGSASQTFTSSSSLKWRVLGWDETTGGVILISEAPIGSFTMKGAIGYLYAEQELNEICKIYGYGTGADTSKTFKYLTGDVIEGTTEGTITGSGARSINVDDINKICNVTSSQALNSNYGKAPYTKSIYYPTTSTAEGYTGPTSRTEVISYYGYRGSTYLTDTEEPYKMLFRNTANSGNITYWLASRCVYSASSGSHFRPRFVDNGGVSGYTLGYGDSRGFSEAPGSYGVRPIVYLKSTVQTRGKDSSGAWTIKDN